MATQNQDRDTESDRQSATGGRAPRKDSYDEEGLAMSRMTGHKSEQIPSAAEGESCCNGDQTSDDRITASIKEQFTRHGEVDLSDVETQVHDGIVTLAGTVTSDESKRQVEDIVKAASNGCEVINQLRVRSKDQFPDNPAPRE